MNKTNKNFRQKLLKAIKLNNIETVKIMLEKNNIDLKFWKDPTEVMVELLNKDYIEMFKLLMKQEIDLDPDCIDNSKVLILASTNGYIEIVKLLLDFKINLNVKDNNKSTGLTIACENGDIEIVKLLLKSNANPNIRNRNENTGLIIACENEEEEIVKLLLDSKADLNIKGENEYTALIAAVANENKKIIKLLLDSKADLDIKNIDGITPLMLATENGNIEVVKLLLNFKLDIDMQDKIGRTALIIGCENKEKEIVKLLLDSKADPNIQDEVGRTALAIVSKNENQETQNFVLDQKLDFDMGNDWTSLIPTTDWGYKDIIKMLLENNASLNIRDNNNISPLMILSELGDDEILELIINCQSNDISEKKLSTAMIEEKKEKPFQEKMKIDMDVFESHLDIFINDSKEKINKKVEKSKKTSSGRFKNLDKNKKVFIVDSFFKSYFAKRLDKEEFELFLFEKGYEILDAKDHQNLRHGNRIKKLKTENNFFELRINRGDRIIFTFKEDGIIFLCVDNHNNAVKRGKNTEINNLIKLSAKAEDISQIDTKDIILNPVFEYNSLEEIKKTYENNRELYKLTREQQNIINKKLPICLYGSAGSGKTIMLLKKIEKILRDNKDAKILFLTHNKKLLRYTKGLYETYSGYRLKQINFKDINDFFREELSITDTEDNYFSYEKFKEWFLKKSRYNIKLKDLSVLEVFSEIKGIIKGFVGFHGKRDIEKENIISKKYYRELKNKYSLLKNDETRELVYSLGIDYEKHLKNEGYYDENDLAMRYLKEENKGFKYDFIACDEVQDLTELQILSVLEVIRDKKNVFLTGDNNQAINLSFFDFGRLETLYRENYNFKKLENSEISINYRSGEKIVKLAKKIAEIREETLITNKKISYRERSSIKEGNIPILASFDINDISQLEDKDVMIIVPSIELKKNMGKKYENTILTIYESKGMERENIVCVGLVDYFKDDVDKIVKVIKNNNIEKLSNHYRHFFNLFYVAVTRAKKTLIFLDDIDNSFFNLLEKLLYKTSNKNWLDNFIEIEGMSDEKILKYAKEFEEKGLYFEALKNYKKIKDIDSKIILKIESFIKFENKKYKEALEGFERLKMWNESFECAKKLKDKKSKDRYQIKIYEKEKNYLMLAEFYNLNLQWQLAFDTFIKYFREEDSKLNKGNQIFFNILPKIDPQKIEKKDKEFIVEILGKKSVFYRLVVDILVLDRRYKEAKELLELQKNKDEEDELKIILLKEKEMLCDKKIGKVEGKKEKRLYKNYYLNRER